MAGVAVWPSPTAAFNCQLAELKPLMPWMLPLVPARGVVKESVPPESVRLLLRAALARLAPPAVNELPPASVAVMLLGSFSVLVIVTGVVALTVPTPAETSAVPIVTAEPNVVTPELWVRVPMAVSGRVESAAVHQRRGKVVAVGAGRAPGDGQTGHAAGIAQVHRAGEDGRGAQGSRRSDRRQAAAGGESRDVAAVEGQQRR